MKKIQFTEFCLTDNDKMWHYEAFGKKYHYIIFPVYKEWKFSGYGLEKIDNNTRFKTYPFICTTLENAKKYVEANYE